jgi:flagellar biosynthesis protein FlhB
MISLVREILIQWFNRQCWKVFCKIVREVIEMSSNKLIDLVESIIQWLNCQLGPIYIWVLMVFIVLALVLIFINYVINSRNHK